MINTPPFLALHTSPPGEGPQSIAPLVSLEIDDDNDLVVNLLIRPAGSREVPRRIWTGHFGTTEDRDALLAGGSEGRIDIAFLARVVLAFGAADMDEAVDKLLIRARADREERAREAEQEARDYTIIKLFTRDGKGLYRLDLERRSRNEPDWSVAYNRAIERDRLRDWLRWQKERFSEFLDYAAQHGNEALTRILTDEMFATERRVKKEGRGAGGMRPLRMWRGD